MERKKTSANQIPVDLKRDDMEEDVAKKLVSIELKAVTCCGNCEHWLKWEEFSRRGICAKSRYHKQHRLRVITYMYNVCCKWLSYPEFDESRDYVTKAREVAKGYKQAEKEG